LEKLGFTLGTNSYFDTLMVQVDAATQTKLKALATAAQVNFRYQEGAVFVAFDEAKTIADAEQVLAIFAGAKGLSTPFSAEMADSLQLEWPAALVRTSTYLTHPVFNSYHSEHEMLRYIKKLESKDLSLVHSMIALGSCTMKLNATAEMIPVTWPEFGQIHPFAPIDQTEGYQELFTNLRTWLTEITGFADTSLQPNSGAQGEYAGLMVIRAYHLNRGEGHRNVALIPTSAHGTNPASAVMAGMKVVLVNCDDKGNIDVEDLKARAEEHAGELSCLMVTYPSTHGVFEEAIQEICATIHSYGGQVYMDGANMNAQVGVTSQLAQDLLHPSRWRRSRHGSNLRSCALGSFPSKQPFGKNRG
jgi:glycine dehydrogenase